MKNLNWVMSLAAIVAVSACIRSGPRQAPSPGHGRGQGPAARDDAEKVAAGPAPAMPGNNVAAIKVNTVGYAVGWRKLAIFNVAPKNALIQNASGARVHDIDESTAIDKGVDAASQDPTWQVDFSAFDTPGRYVIVADGPSGPVKSVPFVIGKGIYDEALVAGLKQFYFQRDRTRLVAPYAVWKGEGFLRPGIAHVHDDMGWLFDHFPKKDEASKWKTEKGWHDAGNYDLYVPSQAPTVQALFLAYESRPDLFDDGQLTIPESGNGVPDILDEAAWGLSWVLTMQETTGPMAGAFRVRETILNPQELESPDKDRITRWIDFHGSASTGKGCAVAALGARLFEAFDPAFARRNRAAAQLAWRWIQDNPERLMVKKYMGAAKKNHFLVWDDGDKAPSDIGARFVCAVEVWRTFRDEKALAMVEALMEHEQTSVTPENWINAEWKNITRWGMIALTRDAKTPARVREAAKARILNAADLMKERVQETDGYRCASLPGDYYWASNSTLMEKAQILVEAARLDPEGHGWAQEAARDQWHWVLGRNPNGYSMVTRVGKGPTALYHGEWGHRSPKPPPGYLVGGPNAAEMKFLAPGAPAKALLWDNPTAIDCDGVKTPAHSMWHSNQCNLWAGGFLPQGTWWPGWYANTEGDIYYNGNLVLVATAMQG